MSLFEMDQVVPAARGSFRGRALDRKPGSRAAGRASGAPGFPNSARTCHRAGPRPDPGGGAEWRPRSARTGSSSND